MTKRNIFEKNTLFNKNRGIAMSNISDSLSAIVNDKNRFGQKFTQKKLAEMVGCDQSYISGMLKGDKRINDVMLEKLCTALEIKLSDLENWNPELAEIRLSRGSGKVAPPELVKARVKLEKLYHSNHPAFTVVVATIDASLKNADKAQPEAGHEKKAAKKEGTAA